MSIELVMPSNHLILCRPLLFLPSILPSIRVFSSELTLHIRWPKYWSFSFSISSYNGYSGLISFRNDWFEILAVQRTLKSLLQHFSLKALPGTIPGTVDTSGNKRDPNLALAACILNIWVHVGNVWVVWIVEDIRVSMGPLSVWVASWVWVST